MDLDWPTSATPWRQITLESLAIGAASLVVALVLTQHSYEAVIAFRWPPLPASQLQGVLRDAKLAAERRSGAPVKLSIVAAAAGEFRLNCRSEVPSAAQTACAHVARAVATQANRMRASGTQAQATGSALNTQYYLLATLPALVWLAIRVRRAQLDIFRAAELEGWSTTPSDGRQEQQQFQIAPSFRAPGQRRRCPEAIAGMSPPETNVRRVEHSSSSQAEELFDDPIGAPNAGYRLADETKLSTRVIFRVGGNPFRPDAHVLTSSTLDQLDELREQLLSRDSQVRVIRVASGVGGRYAKTQIAVQLATLLAERTTGRVLIAEGDLDAPALHRVMRVEAPLGLGFSEQLQRHLPDESPSVVSIMRLEGTLYALLESRVSSPAALGLPQFASVIDDLRHEHEFIVVDGPVVDTWPDASHLADCVDGVVLVAAAGTRLHDTLSLGERHFSSEAMLGIVTAGHWVATG